MIDLSLIFTSVIESSHRRLRLLSGQGSATEPLNVDDNDGPLNADDESLIAVDGSLKVGNEINTDEWRIVDNLNMSRESLSRDSTASASSDELVLHKLYILLCNVYMCVCVCVCVCA